MAGSSTEPQRSMGTTLELDSKAIGKLKSIDPISPTADEIDVTTLDVTGGYKKFLQGFKDAGELKASGFLAYGDAGQVSIVTLFNSGAEKEATVTFPDGTSVTFDCYVKGYSIGGANVDGAVEFSLTLRITGAPTVAAAPSSGGSGD